MGDEDIQMSQEICADSLLKTPVFQTGEGGSHPTSALQVSRITKEEAKRVLVFHYLWGKSRSFRFSYGYGLFCSGELLGVCVFARLPYPELVDTLFGLPRWDQKGFYELSRLCLNPTLQTERGKNFSSRLVAQSIRQLRKTTPTRAIFSYADSEVHVGTVYQALNFRYLGLTDPKYDYWEVAGLEKPRRVTRGAVAGRGFSKIPRSKKHRYVQVFDESLTLQLPVLPNPRRESTPPL